MDGAAACHGCAAGAARLALRGYRCAAGAALRYLALTRGGVASLLLRCSRPNAHSRPTPLACTRFPFPLASEGCAAVAASAPTWRVGTTSSGYSRLRRAQLTRASDAYSAGFNFI